jgi:hypothetical protein
MNFKLTAWSAQTGCQGFKSWQGQNLSLCHHIQTTFEANLLSCPRSSFPGLMQLEWKDEHLPPLIARPRIHEALTPHLPYDFIVQCLMTGGGAIFNILH